MSSEWRIRRQNRRIDIGTGCSFSDECRPVVRIFVRSAVEPVAPAALRTGKDSMVRAHAESAPANPGRDLIEQLLASRSARPVGSGYSGAVRQPRVCCGGVVAGGVEHLPDPLGCVDPATAHVTWHELRVGL